jgi:glutathione peroxidase-family protein
MKLRVRNNSIRLRLTRTEVEQFREIGRVEEKVIFGVNTSSQIAYAVQTAAVENVAAEYENGQILILVPNEIARNWTQTNEIGIAAEQKTGTNSPSLKILIEKDFACLSRRDDEDDADSFPHSEQNKKC